MSVNTKHEEFVFEIRAGLREAERKMQERIEELRRKRNLQTSSENPLFSTHKRSKITPFNSYYDFDDGVHDSKEDHEDDECDEEDDE